MKQIQSNQKSILAYGFKYLKKKKFAKQSLQTLAQIFVIYNKKSIG